MGVKHVVPNKDLSERVDKLTFALTLLLQQIENIEEIDKGVLEIVKKIIAN